MDPNAYTHLRGECGTLHRDRAETHWRRPARGYHPVQALGAILAPFAADRRARQLRLRKRTAK